MECLDILSFLINNIYSMAQGIKIGKRSFWMILAAKKGHKFSQSLFTFATNGKRQTGCNIFQMFTREFSDGQPVRYVR